MIQFDWTISVGTILSTLVVLGSFGMGVYRMVCNHLDHFEQRVNARFDEIDKDIRELRDWTIVMRGERIRD